jgi:hypothetical protein
MLIQRKTDEGPAEPPIRRGRERGGQQTARRRARLAGAPPAVLAPGQQLDDSQPATAAWQELRSDRAVSLVQVHAVRHAAGARAAAPQAACPRVGAARIATSAAGRSAVSDGVTLVLARSGRRWLASAVLSW